MNKRIPIFIGFILVCIAIWVLFTPNKMIRGLIESLDNLGYDLQLRTEVFTQPVKPAATVAIIDIDDKSLKAEGRWPWPRSKLAELVNALHDDGVAIVAFDIFFPEPQTNLID